MTEVPANAVFDWGVGSNFGWGIYGLNLSLAWSQRRDLIATCAHPFNLETLDVDPIDKDLLRKCQVRSAQLRSDLSELNSRSASINGIVLDALHNGLTTSARDVVLTGSTTFAVAFLDDPRVPDDAVSRVSHYRAVIAGSEWNARVLRFNGAPEVITILQGVDTSRFHPAPKRDVFADRFVVFSGGKLESRKGQDLVIRSFSRFQKRHPEALLIAAWAAPWSISFDTPLFDRNVIQPTVDSAGVVDVHSWAESNGIPRFAIYSVGLQSNRIMPGIVREADVALFPNRCEGGTNLVAMECIASGVPTILSANTGHLDLLARDLAMPLHRQSTIAGERFSCWGESDVDEIDDALEQAYRMRSQARAAALKRSSAISTLTWKSQMDRLASELLERC